MQVDQRHITTIRMHDAKGCDIQLAKDGDDYQLQLSSANHVVNISLGLPEMRKLCQQIVQLDMEESWRQHAAPPPEYKSYFFNGSSPRIYPDALAGWFARMAGELCEKSSQR
jgi:hypothetical protein